MIFTKVRFLFIVSGVITLLLFSSCTIHAFDGKAPLICFSKQCFNETMSARKKKIKNFFKSKQRKNKHKTHGNSKSMIVNENRTGGVNSFDTAIVVSNFTPNNNLSYPDTNLVRYFKNNKAKIKSLSVQSFHQNNGLFKKRPSKKRRISVSKFLVESKVPKKKIHLNPSVYDSVKTINKVVIYIDFK